jgi:integrase
VSAVGSIVLADPDTVDAIAEAVDPPYRVLVQLLRHTALRWSEAVALRRKHCHLVEGSLEVAEHLVETSSGPRFRAVGRIYGWVSLPDGLREALAEHLDRYVGTGGNALVFTNGRGGPLFRKWFEDQQWQPALRRAGLADEGWGVDTLQTARLWAWVQEAQRQRAELLAKAHGDGSSLGWRRP